MPLARVTVNGETHHTDGAGFIQLEKLNVGRFHARFDAEGFAPATLVTALADGQSPYEEVRLWPNPIIDSFDIEEAHTIETEGVRIDLPPDALVNQYGEPLQGKADVGAVVLDASDPAAIERLPGHLKATSSGGESVVLRSLGMVEVSFWQDGEPLQLAPGALARVELALPDVGDFVSVGDEISAWSLDLDTGSWVEEGVGVVEDDGMGGKVWVVYVSHFSWLNCDLAIATSQMSCFAVTVTDINGKVVPNVKLTVTDNLPGTFKDGGTSYTTPENQGGNCVVGQMGSIAQINVGESSNLLAQVNIATLSNSSLPPDTPLPDDPNKQGVCYTNSAEPIAGDPEDTMPASLNTSCEQVTVVLSSEHKRTCQPGQVSVCKDYAYPDKIDKGICRPNRSYCINGGLTETACMGEVKPLTYEDCLTLADDNCQDGTDDYDHSSSTCECNDPSDEIECYTGPTSTVNEGVCKTGASFCAADPSGGWDFGACEGDTLPSTEDCTTTEVGDPSPDDENCDGNPLCTGDKRSAQNTTGVVLLDAAVDRSGNVYALGQVEKGASFAFLGSDTSDFVPPTESSTFLVKFNANDAIKYSDIPKVAWTRVYADTSSSAAKPTTGTGIALYETEAGVAAIYIIGAFEGSIVGKNNEVLTNASNTGDDLFVARLNSSGEVEWMNAYSGMATIDGVPTGAAIKADGSKVFLTGYVYGSFADWTKGASSEIDMLDTDADAFVLALDANDLGKTIWAKTFGSTSKDTAVAIAVDADSNDVVIAGNHSGTFDAGPQIDNGPTVELMTPTSNPYVAKFDENGNAKWIRSIDANGGDARDLALDSSGVIYVAGTHVESVGGQDNNDAYVASFGSTGTPGWFNDINKNDDDDTISAGLERGEAIAVDARGNLVVAATFIPESSSGSSLSEFEGIELYAEQGQVHVAVAKLYPSGELIWAQYPNLDGSARALGVSPRYGDIYVMGTSLFAELAP